MPRFPRSLCTRGGWGICLKIPLPLTPSPWTEPGYVVRVYRIDKTVESRAPLQTAVSTLTVISHKVVCISGSRLFLRNFAVSAGGRVMGHAVSKRRNKKSSQRMAFQSSLDDGADGPTGLAAATTATSCPSPTAVDDVTPSEDGGALAANRRHEEAVAAEAASAAALAREKLLRVSSSFKFYPHKGGQIFTWI